MRDQPLTWALIAGVFLFINAPSVKIFTVQGPYINVLAFGLIGGVFTLRLTRGSYELTDRQGIAAGMIGVAFVLIVVPEYLGIRTGTTASIDNVVSLLLILGTTLALLGVTRRSEIRLYLAFQVVWAAFVSATLLLGVADPRGHDVYHYNTVSVPIALGLCVVIGYLVHPTVTLARWQRFGLIGAPAIGLPALVSQHGRSAYVGLFGATVLAVILISLTRSRELAVRTLVRATAALGIGIGALLVLIRLGFVSRLFVDRMTSLFTDITSLGRFELYATTVERILSTPLGHGLGAFDQISVHSYPHNLFLHAAFAGGVIAGVLFFAGVSILVVEYLYAFFETPTAPVLALGLISAYLLFTFSISYSITHTYMVFTALAMAAGLSSKGRILDLRPLTDRLYHLGLPGTKQ
ncbi:O-antigen ligase family protein [Natrononativus amylolyticus]|uniref:O-antigen ligase family protein n=1 Tax=Natrononativus amylolyticus TaxID=2963434 RepID=UPI0020CD5F10|nr:O-antigen ligase family protein [Natrononativus amylolyticus]